MAIAEVQRPTGIGPENNPLIVNGLPPKAAESPIVSAVFKGPTDIAVKTPAPVVAKRETSVEKDIRELLESTGGKTPEQRLFQQRVASYQRIGELVEPGVMGSHEWLWEVGKFFQNERLRLRMSQPELARRASYTDDSIRHLEAGFGHGVLGIFDGKTVDPYKAARANLPKAIARALGDEEGIHKKFLIEFGLMTSDEANMLYEKPKPIPLPSDNMSHGFQMGVKNPLDQS